MVDYIAKHWKVANQTSAMYTGGDIYWSAKAQYIICICNTYINVIDIITSTIVSTITIENEDIISFAVTKNEKFIICFTKANLYRKWNIEILESPVCVMSFKLPFNCISLCMDFDQTGVLVACGCSDRTVKVFDIDKKICTHNFTGHTAIVTKVQFHPIANKYQIVSCSEDSTVKIWDLVMKQCCHTFNHGSVVTDFSFHPTNNILFVNEINFKVHLYDVGVEFSRIKTIKLEKNSSCLAVIAKKSNEYKLALGSEDGTISIVNSIHSEAQATTIAAIGQQFTKFLYNSRLKGLLAITKDQNLLFYTIKEEPTLTKCIAGFIDEITDITSAETETDKFVVVSTNSEAIKIFNQKDHSRIGFLVGHQEIVMCLTSWHQYVASGSRDMKVMLWKINSLNDHPCIGTFTGHLEIINCIALFPKKCSKLVSASQDRNLKVWDCQALLDQNDNIQIASSTFTQVVHDKTINSIKISPNEAVMATASQDKTIKIWNAKTFQLLNVIKDNKRGVWDIQFSPTEKLLASAGGDGIVKLWNIDTYECVKTLEKHELAALKVGWISNGQQLVSGSADGVLKIWNLKKSECIQSYAAHEGKVWALHADCKSNQIITGGTDSLIKTWSDVTLQTIEEERDNQKQLIQDKQSITSLFINKEYSDAAVASFKIGSKKECISILDKLLNGNTDDGIDCIDYIIQNKEGIQSYRLEEVGITVKELKTINLKFLLEIIKEYIVNSRYFKVAEVLLHFLMSSLTTKEIKTLLKEEYESRDRKGTIGFYKIMEIANEFSSKHLERIRRQIQKAHILKLVSENTVDMNA